MQLFQNRGYEALEDFLSLADSDLETAIASIGMLKGHAYKFRRAVDAARTGDRRPKNDEKAKGKPVAPSSPVSKPGPIAAKPLPALTKDVQRLIGRLGEIDQMREFVLRARDAILSIDLDRFVKGLEQVEAVQHSIRDMDATE